MMTPVSPARSIRFLALGDSYTIGESVAEGERWPNQMSEMLLEKDIRAEVTIIARTGWTTDELWQGVQVDPPQRKYDLVSLLIGVNNQFRGYDLDQYREQFRLLLNKSVEYAGSDASHVIVLSIPDWGVTPFAAGRDPGKIARDIDAFNAVNRAESVSLGAHYIDITPISRRSANDPTLIAFDGLHPSGKMYGLWVAEVLPVAVKILNKK